MAVTAEGVSLAGGAAAQRQLLAAGGARLRWRTVFGLVLASTGLARVMPAGPVTGGAWQVREYRRRGAGTGPGVWAVLAGGFTSTVVMVALLLAGAAAAGIGPLPLLACAARCWPPARRAYRRGAPRPRAQPAAGPASQPLAPDRPAGCGRGRVVPVRAGPGWAAGVLACTGTGLLADAGVLAACFGLAGLPVPWRGLLFAYAAGQLAGRLVPLPGGIGGVEGGMLGALALAGTPPAAAAAAVIVYRVAGYWAVGATGTAVAASLARRPRGGRAGTHPAARGLAAAGRDVPGQPRTPAGRHRGASCCHRKIPPLSPPSGDAFPGVPFITCLVTARQRRPRAARKYRAPPTRRNPHVSSRSVARRTVAPRTAGAGATSPASAWPCSSSRPRS